MKMFKVGDIKIGYVLKVRDEYENDTGLARVVFNKYGKLGVSGSITYFPLDCFDENLEYAGTTVLAVYGRASNEHEWKLDTEGRQLLWERKEPKKMVAGEILEKLGFTPENFKTKAMTVEEICQELGYEVEIIDE